MPSHGFSALGIAHDPTTGREICQRCWNGTHTYTGHNSACRCICRDAKPATKRHHKQPKPEQTDIATAYGTVRV